MIELKNKEMYDITGGSVSGAVITAISKIVSTLYEVGQGLGSSLRRLFKEEYCPLN